MAKKEVTAGGVCSCSNHTQEFPAISADLEEWKLWGFDQMEAGWASTQRADSLVIGQNTFFLFPISINREHGGETHTCNLKRNCQNKTEVSCGLWKGWREGRALYIGDLNWFQKSGVIQGHTVFSLAWSISWLPYRGSGSAQSIRRMGNRDPLQKLNSFFCSVTFQNSCLVRPGRVLSFSYCFYSDLSLKKKKVEGKEEESKTTKHKADYVFCESSRGLCVHLCGRADLILGFTQVERDGCELSLIYFQDHFRPFSPGSPRCMWTNACHQGDSCVNTFQSTSSRALYPESFIPNLNCQHFPLCEETRSCSPPRFCVLFLPLRYHRMFRYIVQFWQFLSPRLLLMFKLKANTESKWILEWGIKRWDVCTSSLRNHVCWAASS